LRCSTSWCSTCATCTATTWCTGEDAALSTQRTSQGMCYLTCNTVLLDEPGLRYMFTQKKILCRCRTLAAQVGQIATNAIIRESSNPQVEQHSHNYSRTYPDTAMLIPAHPCRDLQPKHLLFCSEVHAFRCCYGPNSFATLLLQNTATYS
jgi:hypothetical protein